MALPIIEERMGLSIAMSIFDNIKTFPPTKEKQSHKTNDKLKQLFLKGDKE